MPLARVVAHFDQSEVCTFFSGIGLITWLESQSSPAITRPHNKHGTIQDGDFSFPIHLCAPSNRDTHMSPWGNPGLLQVSLRG